MGLYACCMVGVIFLAYIINPIGIWGGPVIYGFNHYKTKQSLYEDVFKPYEIMRIQPDVVYIGSSQVDQGFDLTTVKTNDECSYNMGIA